MIKYLYLWYNLVGKDLMPFHMGELEGVLSTYGSWGEEALRLFASSTTRTDNRNVIWN